MVNWTLHAKHDERDVALDSLEKYTSFKPPSFASPSTNTYDKKIYMQKPEAPARSLITSDDVTSSTTPAATDR